MAVAELRLFGTFELRLCDGRVIDLPGQKDRALLAVLALSASASQARERLAGLLWGDSGESQARDSLKHALIRLRQCLNDVTPAPIIADRQSVRFDPAGLSIDVTQFDRLVRADAGRARASLRAVCRRPARGDQHPRCRFRGLAGGGTAAAAPPA